MKVVITGASGFLGRALTRRLWADGVDVVRVTRQELDGFTTVESYADSPSGDVLVHLAEASDRERANEEGVPYEQAALAVIDSLLRKNYQRVVYASSAALYGDGADAPRRVTDPIHVVDTYTRIKFAAEQAVSNGNGVIARFTNVYGPGMSEANVLSSILRQLPENGPITLRDLTPVRDFLWFDDAAEALHAMIAGRATGTFNVGTGRGMSIADVVQTMLDRVGQHARSVVSERHGTNPSYLVVEIEETTAAFGWHPRTPFPDGMDLLLGSRIQNG